MKNKAKYSVIFGAVLFLILLNSASIGLTCPDSFTLIIDSTSQTKRVAILVIRVGNIKAFSPMEEVSLKTDYSIRTPKYGTDVFIENDIRLAESIPSYPHYPGNDSGYEIEYFKNISKEITESIKPIFGQKGYSVVDFKEYSINWDRSYSEMTLKEIILKLKDNVDYLFILHYMDVGKSRIDSRFYNVTASNSAFTSFLFTYSLFDVRNQKRILSYTPLIGFATIPAIVYNPKIMKDSELRNRITVDCNLSDTRKSYSVTHSFSEEELIHLLLENLINGFTCPKEKYLDCFDLEKCSTFEIKGLKFQLNKLNL